MRLSSRPSTRRAAKGIITVALVGAFGLLGQLSSTPAGAHGENHDENYLHLCVSQFTGKIVVRSIDAEPACIHLDRVEIHIPLSPVAGPAGADGVDGADGPQGPEGPAGADGAGGPQGPAGPAGVAGAPGANGADGAPGANGAEGPAGPQGPAGGPQGIQGIQGVQGGTGATGAAGADGAPGATGAPGVDGANGAPGADGANGSNGGTLLAGGASLPGGDTTEYIRVGAFASHAAQATAAVPVPLNGTLSNLVIRLTTAPGVGESYSFNIFVNGVDTGLECNVTEAATTCDSGPVNVEVVIGDTVSLEANPTTGSSATVANFSMVLNEAIAP